MATITFYKTTLDGENYPEDINTYLISKTPVTRTVRQVNPSRESYYIEFSDPLPDGYNLAKITVSSRLTSDWYYMVTEVSAPIVDGSFGYTLTLDKFLTACASVANEHLLDFPAATFYGEGTESTAPGQTPVDSLVDMSTLSRNVFTTQQTDGFIPLIFVEIDGEPVLLCPSRRMDEAFEYNGINQANAIFYADFCSLLAKAGELHEWTHTPSETTDGIIKKVKFVRAFIVPAIVWNSVGSVVYKTDYDTDPARARWKECTIESGQTAASTPNPNWSWAIAYSARTLSSVNILSVGKDAVCFFGGSNAQAQTMPCGLHRNIKLDFSAISENLTVILRDEFGGAVDCSASCLLTAVIPSETNTEASLRNMSAVMSAGMSAVGLAGSVISGNVAGAIAGVGGLAQGIGGAVRTFSAPPPTAATSGATFFDLRGEFCPLFIHTAKLARPIEEYGYTPPRLLKWETMNKTPSPGSPVYFRGRIAGAAVSLPESWLNNKLADGVRIWYNSDLDKRGEVFA